MNACSMPGCQTTAGCICDRVSSRPVYHVGTPERALVYAWEGEVAGLHAKIKHLEGFVDFVNLWLTRDRRGMTDAEVLSVILHHPTASDRRRALTDDSRVKREPAATDIQQCGEK